MTKYYVNSILLVTFFTQLALANEGHEEHSAGVPIAVLYQAINVFVIFVGLIYFLRRPLAKMYSERRDKFIQAEVKARTAREHAEQENSDIRIRLNKLETDMEDSILRARADASDLKKQIIADAHAVSKRIKEDTDRTINLELSKAKAELQGELVEMAFQGAQKALAQNVGAEEQKRLQSEFVEKIQVGIQ